jgi:hypothetical protein
MKTRVQKEDGLWEVSRYKMDDMIVEREVPINEDGSFRWDAPREKMFANVEFPEHFGIWGSGSME